MRRRFALVSALMVVVLGVVYFQIAGRSSESIPVSSHLLLQKAEPSAVKILQINRGTEQVSLALSAGHWVVEDRGGYSADTSKITSLLLRLFDLHVSDSTKVLNPDLEALGLAGESFKKGFLKLSLLSEDRSEVISIFAGQGRTREASQIAKPTGGQYIKSSSDLEAYLVMDPIIISASPKLWIDTNLLNVLQVSIHDLKQFKIDHGKEIEEFSFVRTDPTKDATPIGFELRSAKPDDRTFEESVLTQLRAILENMRIEDVFPAGQEETKDLVFDRVTRVGTREGAVYSVFTAEKAAEKAIDKGRAGQRRIFARVEVSFDPKIVEGVKASLANAPREPDQKEILAATSTEVERLNGLFRSWIYELPPFQAQKFRFSTDDLFVVNRPQNVLQRE